MDVPVRVIVFVVSTLVLVTVKVPPETARNVEVRREAESKLKLIELLGAADEDEITSPVVPHAPKPA